MYSIESTILVNAPVSECYRHWRDVERFPQYMRRVRHVRRIPAEKLSDLSPLPQPQWDPQRRYYETMTGQVLTEVYHHVPDAWEWEVQGPLGRIYTFRAGVVQEIPNKVISWSSAADQELATSGTVNFLKPRPEKPPELPGDEQTLIEVKMSFSAASAPFGELMADVFRVGQNVVNECLEDFKNYVEREAAHAREQQRLREAKARREEALKSMPT